VLQLHLGLTRPVRDLGIDAHLTVRFPDSDVDGCLSRRGLYPEGFSVTAPALEDDVSGRERVLSVVGGVSGEAWCRLDGYAQAKKEATQHILALVDDLFPGVASAVQVSDLSTPRTFQRYANTPCGAILGFAPQPRMHRHLRTASRPPIGNLHLASAWTDQMGGLLPALKAGLRAAERISG
jgi:phytoene dehydrogenase-like protein